MWELVRANKRRSVLLVLAMLLILLVLGFLIGSALVPSIAATEWAEAESTNPVFAFDPGPGFVGMAVAFIIWLIQASAAYFSGDKILLRSTGAREIQKADHTQLFNVVEEMTIASRLPRVPRVFIIDSPAMNAFATGRRPENAAVAITTGLLGRLNRDQLQGVIGHEIAHVANRDVLFMTMVAVMLGSIVMISELFLRGMFHGARRAGRFSSGKKGGGGGQVVMIVLALLFAVIAPILAQFIYLAASRRREYLADAGSAVYTRYPEGLASALETLAGDTHKLRAASRATAPMFIVNPLNPMSMHSGLTSTHPPLEERVRILRGLAGGVSFARYQAAWRKVSGRNAPKMPVSALKAGDAPIRAPHPEPAKGEEPDPRMRLRQAGDALRSVNQFVFLPCTCGLKIKLPPEFKQDSVACPRCGRTLEVPMAQVAAIGALTEAVGDPGLPAAIRVAKPRVQPEPPLTITKRGNDWMSFKCTCGAVKNLAPSFAGTRTQCGRCGREILVTSK